MIIEISNETIKWVRKAQEDYDPLRDGHDLPRMACKAVANAISNAEDCADAGPSMCRHKDCPPCHLTSGREGDVTDEAGI